MAKRVAPLLPPLERRLSRLGTRLREARLRRHLPAKLIAERAGMSLMTLRSVERGSMGVTIGAYAAVLHVLGLDGDLDAVAATDTLGRDLQDASLPKRARTKARSAKGVS
jgi:transcriptional regulator with XRE-family HTH domain